MVARGDHQDGAAKQWLVENQALMIAVIRVKSARNWRQTGKVAEEQVNETDSLNSREPALAHEAVLIPQLSHGFQWLG